MCVCVCVCVSVHVCVCVFWGGVIRVSIKHSPQGWKRCPITQKKNKLTEHQDKNSRPAKQKEKEKKSHKDGHPKEAEQQKEALRACQSATDELQSEC